MAAVVVAVVVAAVVETGTSRNKCFTRRGCHPAAPLFPS